MRKLDVEEVWNYTKWMWFVGIEASCFFCEMCTGSCATTCPASLVEKNWNCCTSKHKYYVKPGAFYREILRLDAIRIAVSPEHVWEHGDVFKNGSGHMMYLISVCGQESMVWIDNKMVASCSISEYHRDCTFLFNIKDAIKERND